MANKTVRSRDDASVVELYVDQGDGTYARKTQGGAGSLTADGIIDSAGDVVVPTQILGARRMAGMFKLMGCVMNNEYKNQTGSLSSASFTTTILMQFDCRVEAMQVVAVNRSPNQIRALKAVVGVTETADTSVAANIGVPVIGGVRYAALAGTTDLLGFVPVTWQGLPNTEQPRSLTQQTAVLSEKSPNASIPRADGGAGYLHLIRAHINGSVTPLAFGNTYTAALRTPSAPMRNRILQCSNSFNDAVLSLGNAQTLATTSIEAYAVAHLAAPGFFVWSGGDSLIQNDGIVADKTTSWMLRACLTLSTEARPVIHSNLGASGKTAADAFELAKTFLESGVPPPSMFVLSVASVNDGPVDARIAAQQMARLADFIKLCADYKIPYPAIPQLFPHEDYTLAQDNARKAQNTALATACAAANITFMTFPGISDGASPEKWVPAYKLNAFHFNEAGVEDVLATGGATYMQNWV